MVSRNTELLDSGEADGLPSLVLEQVWGVTLRSAPPPSQREGSPSSASDREPGEETGGEGSSRTS